jgi:hypothetical protein
LIKYFSKPNPPKWDNLLPGERDLLSKGKWDKVGWNAEARGNSPVINGTATDPAVYVSLIFGSLASGLAKSAGWGMLSVCLKIRVCAGILAPTTGITVYRVWGGDSGPAGGSWTPVDPRTIADYAAQAGLPPGNSGQYLSVGTVYSMDGIQITNASRILTNPGGLLEYYFQDRTLVQIQVIIQEILYLSRQ